MAKRVLGNDPFQRGAAERTDRAPDPKPAGKQQPVKQQPAKKQPAKSAAKKAAPRAAAPKAPRKAAPRRAPPADAPVPAELEARPAPSEAAAQAAGPGELGQVEAATEILDTEPPAPAQLHRDPPGTPQPGSQAIEAAFRTEPRARRVEYSGDFAQRASGVLRLARDMAVQALASEGVGRALGVAQGLVGALRAGLGTGGSSSLDIYGKDAALVGDLRPVLDFLYERYWRVSVQGAELIPEGPVVLVANHSGALPFDGPVTQLALARERPELAEARWLVEDQIFHAPVLGTLFNRLGAVRACQENASRLLDEGRPVLVFPEGIQGLSKPFAQRYQLKRFGRGGFVKLALRTGAPIVPVAIVGAEETSPLLARLPGEFLGLPYLPVTPLGPLPLPAKWSIRFGAPLALGEPGPGAADDLSEVQRLTERTRESIQGMLQALLQERRSVFGG